MREYRAVLDFCAAVASVESLARLSPGQRLIFEEELAKIAGGGASERKRELERLHRWLRKLIVPLVDHELAVKQTPHGYLAPLEVPGAPSAADYLDAVAGSRAIWRVYVALGRIQLGVEGRNEVDTGPRVEDLIWRLLLPGAELPFGRCVTCQRIFTISKRPQSYCSAGCAAKSDPERRREQVRRAGQRYREKKKKKQGA